MKNRFKSIPLYIFIIILAGATPLFAIETAPRISDREIIEALTEIKIGQKALKELMNERFNQIDKRFEQVDKRFEQVDKRFEQVDKRFEQVDKRFEQVDKRFEQVNKRFEQVDKRFEQVDKRFEQMLNLVLSLFGSLMALIIAVLGYSIWDRRTVTKKVSKRVDKIEEDLDIKDINGSKLIRLIKALKNLSKDDHRLAEVLRNFNLL